MACLCAPTSHAGSFRCRLHRGVKSTNANTERASGTAMAKTNNVHHHMIPTHDPPLPVPPTPPPSISRTPPPPYCASLAMIKLFKQTQAGSPRLSHRNPSYMIGPSRLSRMVVACAEELPLLKLEDCTVTPHSGSIAGAAAATKEGLREYEDTGSASFKVMQIKLKPRSNTFKQSESIVGSKAGASLMMMSTVY